MKLQRSLLSLPFLLGLCLLGPLFRAPLSADEVADRMLERLPLVDALKAAGVVGENNRGLLEGRVILEPQQKAIIEAENKDRSLLYERVASSNGLAPSEVARQRAIRIAELAKAGVWVQNAKGDWIRKGR